jgi:hypothetical protein
VKHCFEVIWFRTVEQKVSAHVEATSKEDALEVLKKARNGVAIWDTEDVFILKEQPPYKVKLIRKDVG